jgi:hypothetical protein
VIDAPAPNNKTGSEPSIKRERSRPADDMRRPFEVDPAPTFTLPELAHHWLARALLERLAGFSELYFGWPPPNRFAACNSSHLEILHKVSDLT